MIFNTARTIMQKPSEFWLQSSPKKGLLVFKENYVFTVLI